MAFYVRDVLLAAGIQRVLSFGCGIGQDVIYYAEAGLDVTAADLPGWTYDFAKWRFQRRQLPVETIDITSDDFLAESYDAVTSFEVFNVLVDPITTVEYLYASYDAGWPAHLYGQVQGGLQPGAETKREICGPFPDGTGVDRP